MNYEEYTKKYSMNFWEKWELFLINFSIFFWCSFARYEKYRLYIDLRGYQYDDNHEHQYQYFRIIARCGWDGPWARETVIYGPMRRHPTPEKNEPYEDMQWRHLKSFRLAILDMQSFIYNDSRQLS